MTIGIATIMQSSNKIYLFIYIFTKLFIYYAKVPTIYPRPGDFIGAHFLLLASPEVDGMGASR